MGTPAFPSHHLRKVFEKGYLRLYSFRDKRSATHLLRPVRPRSGRTRFKDRRGCDADAALLNLPTIGNGGDREQLSLANMDFEDFASSADEDGIFRGF